MTDLIPWLDETYIVEMGRLFLCGGDADSILLGRGQSALLPLCYVGPLAHELAFRLCGQVGVRLLPFFALGRRRWPSTPGFGARAAFPGRNVRCSPCPWRFPRFSTRVRC